MHVSHVAESMLSHEARYSKLSGNHKNGGNMDNSQELFIFAI